MGYFENRFEETGLKGTLEQLLPKQVVINVSKNSTSREYRLDASYSVDEAAGGITYSVGFNDMDTGKPLGTMRMTFYMANPHESVGAEYGDSFKWVEIEFPRCSSEMSDVGDNGLYRALFEKYADAIARNAERLGLREVFSGAQTEEAIAVLTSLGFKKTEYDSGWSYYSYSVK